MFCPRCGKGLPEDARFCDICGIALQKPLSKNMQNPSRALLKDRKKELKWWQILVIAGGGILALGALFVVVLFNSNKKIIDNRKTTSTENRAEQEGEYETPSSLETTAKRMLDAEELQGVWEAEIPAFQLIKLSDLFEDGEGIWNSESFYSELETDAVFKTYWVFDTDGSCRIMGDNESFKEELEIFIRDVCKCLREKYSDNEEIITEAEEEGMSVSEYIDMFENEEITALKKGEALEFEELFFDYRADKSESEILLKAWDYYLATGDVDWIGMRSLSYDERVFIYYEYDGANITFNFVQLKNEESVSSRRLDGVVLKKALVKLNGQYERNGEIEENFENSIAYSFVENPNNFYFISPSHSEVAFLVTITDWTRTSIRLKAYSHSLGLYGQNQYNVSVNDLDLTYNSENSCYEFEFGGYWRIYPDRIEYGHYHTHYGEKEYEVMEPVDLRDYW